MVNVSAVKLIPKLLSSAEAVGTDGGGGEGFTAEGCGWVAVEVSSSALGVVVMVSRIVLSDILFNPRPLFK